MAKKIQAIVKLQIEGGAATAAPPVGPALGQHGANIMAFVKEYNEKTSSMKGDVIPVEITIYQDKSFTFELKSPPAAALILKAANIPKGASESGVQIVGKITIDQAKEIGKQKMQDLNAFTIESAMKMVAGTARSMGFTVNGKFPTNS